MGTPTDVTTLMREAANASTNAERERLVGEAEDLRTSLTAQAAAERGVDLANAVIRDVLTPVRVHEHHTAATDWLGDVTTEAPEGVEREMVAQGSMWYSKVAAEVKRNTDELAEQAVGFARRLAGQYGAQADAAESAFVEHVGDLYSREVTAGIIVPIEKEAASGLPQVGDEGAPVVEATVGPATGTGLPGEMTTSERAPNIQAVENNTSAGDNNGWPSPLELPQHDVDAANGDTGTSRDHARAASRNVNNERNASMQTAPCPSCSGCQTCGGRHRVAVRQVPHTAASGLDQIEEIRDPKDNPVTEPPVNWNVAFPWELQDGANAIPEAEKQLADRQKLVGANRKLAAEQAARQAYQMVMSAGYDDSGWAGDMGQGGVRPGAQDQPGGGPVDSLPYQDPVYGQGGDNGNQPLKPYGADEADDFTNNPGMNYQPGDDIQADKGTRVNQVGASLNPDNDPEIAKALAFVRQRRALLESQS